jgi:DNA-binding GntR family transcriptional regulator
LETEHDYTEIGRLNRLFHMALYNKAPNQRLLRLVEDGLNEEERFLRFNLEAMGLGKLSQEDHRALLRAAEERDVEHAVTLLENHLNRGVEVITRYLESSEPQRRKTSK